MEKNQSHLYQQKACSGDMTGILGQARQAINTQTTFNFQVGDKITNGNICLITWHFTGQFPMTILKYSKVYASIWIF